MDAPINSKLSPKRQALVGMYFGRLTVVGPSALKTKSGIVLWDCVCDCGRDVRVTIADVKRGHSRSCGCLQKDVMSELCKLNNPNFIDGRHSTALRVYKSYALTAKRKHLRFDLTIDQFVELIKSPCTYCGDPPSTDSAGFCRNGVDRRDNSYGYTVENSYPCCKFCNRAKGSQPHKVFLDKVTKIFNNNSK